VKCVYLLFATLLDYSASTFGIVRTFKSKNVDRFPVTVTVGPIHAYNCV